MSAVGEQHDVARSEGSVVRPFDTTKSEGFSLASLAGLSPLLQAVDYSKHSNSIYVLERKKLANNAPVFRMSPGLDFVVLTDHVSGTFYLNSPSTVFDREPEMRFGPLDVNDAYVGIQRPAVLACDENGHVAIRDYTIAVMRSRAGQLNASLAPAMNLAIQRCITGFRNDPDTFLLEDATITITSAFMYQWMLDIQPPHSKDLLDYGKNSFEGLETSSKLSNAAMAGISILKRTKSTTREIINQFRALLHTSPVFSSYEKMAQDCGFERTDLDLFIVWLVTFNGAFPLNLILQGAFGVLELQPDTLDALRKELDGQEITFDSVSRFPLLESFAWECQRFFRGPSNVNRVAKQDIDIPAGDGNMYHVKKGERVMASMPVILRDESVFEDAFEFNARRFIRNPDLKKKVFGFGDLFDSETGTALPNRFGCAANTDGAANAVVKMLIASIVQRLEWTMAKTPVIDGEFMGKVGHKDGPLKFSSLKLRTA